MLPAWPTGFPAGSAVDCLRRAALAAGVTEANDRGTTRKLALQWPYVRRGSLLRVPHCRDRSQRPQRVVLTDNPLIKHATLTRPQSGAVR
jgi:hypothetical protein